MRSILILLFVACSLLQDTIAFLQYERRWSTVVSEWACHVATTSCLISTLSRSLLSNRNREIFSGVSRRRKISMDDDPTPETPDSGITYWGRHLTSYCYLGPCRVCSIHGGFPASLAMTENFLSASDQTSRVVRGSF